MNPLLVFRKRASFAAVPFLRLLVFLRERKRGRTRQQPNSVIVTTAALLLVGNQAAFGQFQVTVQGNLQWSDGQNNLHNARQVKVEIHAIDLLGNDTVEATTTTDLDGFYQGSFSSAAPGLLDVYLGVFASGPAGYVSPNVDPNTNVPVAANTYGLQTPTTGVGAGINTISANFTNANDAGRAFGVYDMMLVGSQFANDVRGAPLAALPARFPHAPPPNPNTSFFSSSTNSIYILSGDRWDWDVIGHEYSHYLHNADALTDSPGGGHCFGVSSITGSPGCTGNTMGIGKSPGSRLGWGEGVGNYMGVAMQQVNAAANKFPTNLLNFGDPNYTDTIDASIDFSLELDTGSGVAGEGEEVAVARILWDIADPLGTLPGTHDRVARSHVQLYKDLVAARNRVRTQSGNNAAKLATLHQVNDYYLNIVATNDQQRVDYGAIFEKYSVSPSPTGILADPNAIVDINDIIQFDWLRQNNNANDTFQLIVWNDDFSTRLVDFLIPNDVNSYQLTGVQKALLHGQVGNELKWAVVGSDLYDPNGTAYAGLASTGNYWSDARSFTLVPEPVTLVLLALAAVLIPAGGSRMRGSSNRQSARRESLVTYGIRNDKPVATPVSKPAARQVNGTPPTRYGAQLPGR